ncbi:MAG TPA: exosortase-associated EpsI family protein [Fimbriimonadaceae bacterium]|nr:hypothetical protein [Armatimonadota bacterium]HRD31163.1 exosortase-associated EpsI family protein [Fimbriimonadaceae bacterium]HRE93553.1 exosortase-associated EpsI family protein [Fimbriimonadaceae bacterium]HRI73794.1 exosortase-associated EpsI family protein [Fimbriimonadaceae bacterium]
MKQKIFVVIALFLAVGALANFRSKITGYERLTEDQVEQLMPQEEVAGYRYVKSDSDPMQTYKMDETTYEMLKPFGIVSRVYENNAGQRIDAVLIASDDSDSFHDQQWCFQGQGWEFSKIELRTIDTKTFGKIPVKYIEMNHKERGSAISLFTFKGPDKKFYDSFDAMWWDFITREFKSGKPQAGSFYRFISIYDVSKEDLDAFAAAYIDEVERTSQGKI